MVEYMGCFMRFYGVYVGEWPYFKGKMCRYEEAAGLLACAFGLRDDARPPHEQGAGALRFVSIEAAVGVDGGRLWSRSLPSAK